MTKLYPLTFKENVHTTLWGTESWEISAHASSPSVVANGPLAGRTLDELVKEYGAELVGSASESKDAFPLLFKVIDAKQRLSVQVHPNETTCFLTGGEPKTEMWRVLGGSGPIFAGLKAGTTLQQVENHIRTGEIENTLVRHEAREGLTLVIPGGLVHAIGEDVLIYEVQQSSNTAYRLYDWGRVDLDGKPRQLHIDESLKSIDFSLPVPEGQVEIDCKFFKFHTVESSGEIHIDANPKTFTALFIVNERRSILVPASCSASISCNATVFVTTLL